MTNTKKEGYHGGEIKYYARPRKAVDNTQRVPGAMTGKERVRGPSDIWRDVWD